MAPCGTTLQGVQSWNGGRKGLLDVPPGIQDVLAETVVQGGHLLLGPLGLAQLRLHDSAPLALPPVLHTTGLVFWLLYKDGD